MDMEFILKINLSGLNNNIIKNCTIFTDINISNKCYWFISVVVLVFDHNFFIINYISVFLNLYLYIFYMFICYLLTAIMTMFHVT